MTHAAARTDIVVNAAPNGPPTCALSGNRRLRFSLQTAARHALRCSENRSTPLRSADRLTHYPDDVEVVGAVVGVVVVIAWVIAKIRQTF